MDKIKKISVGSRHIDATQQSFNVDTQYGQGQQPIDLKRQRSSWGDREPVLNNTIYHSSSNGLVVACTMPIDGGDIIGYADDNTIPTTKVAHSGARALDTGTETSQVVLSITFPVKKGEYYKISSTGILSKSYFISLI